MRVSPTKNLAALKLVAKTNIDRQAGEIRKLFITSAPGQEMVYQQKRLEAEAISVSPQIDPLEVPHLAAEAQLNGVSLTDMAVSILMLSEQWKQVSAIIEHLRLGHKALVDAAQTPAQIDTAMNIDWSSVQGLAS